MVLGLQAVPVASIPQDLDSEYRALRPAPGDKDYVETAHGLVKRSMQDAQGRWRPLMIEVHRKDAASMGVVYMKTRPGRHDV